MPQKIEICCGKFTNNDILFLRNVNFNCLPNDKISACSKFKAVADDKISVNQKMKFPLRRVENIVRKAENVGYKHFILSHKVFQSLFFQVHLKSGLCGKVLTQTLVFMCQQYKSFEKTVGKGEIAHNQQFLLFPQGFPPLWRTFFHIHQI